MDSILNNLQEISRLLADCNAAIAGAGDPKLINLRQFEVRDKAIAAVESIERDLDIAAVRVGTLLQKMRDAKEQEVAAMEAVIRPGPAKMPGRQDSINGSPPWTTVRRGKGTKAPPRPPARATKGPQYTQIKFTAALYLQAINVSIFEQVKQDGELYYVESAAHFAFILGGKLFHGNIGMIYNEEKNPEKIKDCKFAATCVKQNNCDYYHDPFLFPGSRDHRNFIAASWLYSCGTNDHSRNKSRRFGARQHLDTDIACMQGEEQTRFFDQTMHDVLCSLLLHQAFSPPRFTRSS